ncbi:hypothetical protein ATCC90586_001749 [Pythium insidiosum]|nr:hypothetical protein ATCC90586_001749 [Pythium insidiosum]
MPVSSASGARWRLGFAMSLLLLTAVSSCLIAGADTGTCTDPSDYDLLIPFCKTVVPYTACLPRYQSLWYNHSALTKDKFVEQMFNKLVTQRKMYETNRTFLDKNTDEWGSKREIQPRFIENPDCENAFRNYFCWLNFPRCDAEGRSLLLCRSNKAFVYYRAPYPGSPFKDNAVDPATGHPLVVCTPSLENLAPLIVIW